MHLSQKNKYFISFALIFLFAFFIRLYPILNNHFYFTVDQGRDATYARDILHGNFPLVGPETDIKGVYHGVLWYYLLAIGYLFSQGHPIGPVIFLILIQSSLVVLTAYALKQKIGLLSSLLTGLTLSLLLPFYETSRYAFNPFLSVSLSCAFIYFLIQVKTDARFYYLSALASGLLFHSEIAAFPIFFFMLVAMGLVFVVNKILTLRKYLIGIFIAILFLIPHIIYEFTHDFSQIHNFINHATGSTSLFQTSFIHQVTVTAPYFYTLIGETTIPLFPLLGVLAYGFFVFYFLFINRNRRNQFSHFVILSNLLLLFSVIWFSTSSGLKPWIVSYLPLPIFISFVVCLTVIPKKIFIGIMSILVLVHGFYLGSRVLDYMKDTGDPGILNNQIQSIDWIYQKAKSGGFSVYTYVPSVYDYPYQYLIYWHGLGKFHYLPSEYSTYPGTDASSYVPHSRNYLSPSKENSGKQFLIMEPPINEGLLKIWHDGAAQNTQLLETGHVGKITLEERNRNN